MNREEVINWLEEIKVKYIHGGDQRYEECRITAIDKAVEERNTGRTVNRNDRVRFCLSVFS